MDFRSESKDVVTLWRVRRTVMQMLHDRGFEVGQQDLDMTLEQFKEIFDKSDAGGSLREKLTTLATKKQSTSSTESHRAFIFWVGDDKLNTSHIRSFAQTMRNERVQQSIIILKGEITSHATKTLTLVEQKFPMEVFREVELLVNITEHELVPKHIPQTEEETKSLLKAYKLKKSQLPRIQFSDPVARYLGLRRDQVVKIIRASETAGRYVTYRLVV